MRVQDRIADIATLLGVSGKKDEGGETASAVVYVLKRQEAGMVAAALTRKGGPMWQLSFAPCCCQDLISFRHVESQRQAERDFPEHQLDPACMHGGMGVGVRCAPYHAGLAADERARVVTDWTEGRLPCVAATVAFGMGIDRVPSLRPPPPSQTHPPTRIGRLHTPASCAT